MPRPQVGSDVVAAIKRAWAKNPKRSATEIHRRYVRQTKGKAIGVRKVQQIVASAVENAKEGGRVQFEPEEWQPWGNVKDGAEDNSNLLRLNIVCQAFLGRSLHKHEADWGRRLRAALEGLSPFRQLFFVMEYASRQVGAVNLGEMAPYTADLDAVVAFQIWIPDNREAYRHAKSRDVIPRPHFDLPLGDAPSNLLRSDLFGYDPDQWETVFMSLEVDRYPPDLALIEGNVSLEDLPGLYGVFGEMVASWAGILYLHPEPVIAHSFGYASIELVKKE